MQMMTVRDQEILKCKNKQLVKVTSVASVGWGIMEAMVAQPAEGKLQEEWDVPRIYQDARASLQFSKNSIAFQTRLFSITQYA
jgi:hypothetical protein